MLGRERRPRTSSPARCAPRRDGWKPTATAWTGWNANDGRSGCCRGSTKRPGWVAGQSTGTRRRSQCLEGRVDARVEAMFHDTHPEGCPTDLLEKQSFLRAHALLAIVGRSRRHGRVDRRSSSSRTTPTRYADGRPSLGLGCRRRSPPRVPRTAPPRQRACTRSPSATGSSSTHPVSLDFGRATRLANRAQRRALRGLYATCAIPGCGVRYSRTKLHHIIWWRHGGSTDLANLLPVCEVHHQKIHHDGWLIIPRCATANSPSPSPTAKS